MRILLISHTCQSRTEGQPKAVELARLPGIDLQVLVPDRWRHYGVPRVAEPPLVDTFELMMGKVRWPWVTGGQFYLHFYPQLRRILEEFQPDIIDLWEEPWALVSAHTCWLRNRILPKTRIVSETEQNIFKRLPPPFQQVRSYVNRNADFMIGRSEEALAVARRTGYSGPGTTVPNGVDVELFRPGNRPAARAALLPDLPFGKVFVAGYVGRLVPEKGVLDLVDSLAYGPESLHLLFVGSGPAREQIERRAAEMGRTAQVHFHGACKLEALPAVMNGLDVLVLPSRTTHRWKEQYGRVIIEAHACGTPVIGSSSGAIPTVVGDGGFVFPEGDSRALAMILKEMEASPWLGEQMGESGRKRVLEHCSWKRVAERMADIYRRVASHSTATGQSSFQRERQATEFAAL